MIVLPSLISKTQQRPRRPVFEESYLIPNTQLYGGFWKKIYLLLKKLKIHSPVRRDINNYINPLFGYFGYCVHPVTHELNYFHTGVSLDLKAGRNVYPVLPGVFEYSGYGAVNGQYVLLSHPQVQTEDGYTLHSMYCHLKKPLVKFNSYQKMLREISLRSYPIIPIEMQTILGVASTTGLSRDNHPGLYLQLSFRKFDQTPIVVDPMCVYHKAGYINQSADIVDPEIIKDLFQKNKKIKTK